MDSKTLASWVDQFTPELYRWAYHKTSSAETAEDLVQETFLAAAQKLESFKGQSSPKTWLFSILNNKIIDVYRKKMKHPDSLDNRSDRKYFDVNDSWLLDKAPKTWNDEEQHLLDNEEFQAVLKDCLGALPENWSTAVKLKYLLEKKGDEICQQLGITPTNLWQIIHRAKLKLRECVEYNWFED